MYKIALCGYSGVMGNDVIGEVKKSDNMKIVAKLSPRKNEKGQDYTGKVDVVIDFSRPANLKFLIDYAIEKNAPLLLFTTGYSNEEFRLMKEAGLKIPVLYSANTALGINALRPVLKELAKTLNFFDIEHVEKHNKNKEDAPSGTGKMFLEDMETILERKVPNHSLRMGTIPGEHTIVFSSVDEVIEISHRSLSHRVYAVGALEVVPKIIGKIPGFYKIEDL